MASIEGTGSGKITDIDAEAGTITLSKVDEFFSINKTTTGSVARSGALAVSDPITSVYATDKLEANGLLFDGTGSLSRRTSAGSNQRTWTFSAWVKRGSIRFRFSRQLVWCLSQ